MSSPAFALAIRLYANMVAGHVIFLSFIALTFMSAVFIPVSVGFSLFIYLLELLVAFLQAYIFTTLTAVFTGMAMASHDHHEEHDSHSDRHATVTDVVTEMATGDYDDLSDELRKHQPAGAVAHLRLTLGNLFRTEKRVVAGWHLRSFALLFPKRQNISELINSHQNQTELFSWNHR